ncbi:hypothetical protein HYX58_05090 [Candidatus Dependentiae bacterium]|nr:hypothetical protein [Candidatus Dependentiae bacterium]
MKKIIAGLLLTFNASSILAMDNTRRQTPPTSSIENLLEGLSIEEKKEIVQTYEKLNSTLQVVSTLVPTEETEIQKKKEDLKKFCIRRIANSSHRDSKDSN